MSSGIQENSRSESDRGSTIPVAKVQVLFGIPVQVATLSDAVDSVQTAVTERRDLHIGVVNSAKVVNMRRDPELRDAVLASDVIYADGMSVVWASRILGKPLPERVAGIDLMSGILKRGSEFGWRVFCLGATQSTLDVVCEKFRFKYPGVDICGSHHGYFSSDEEQTVAEQIREAKPDVLLVAITSPKKEQFMARWGESMQVPVVHGVGGSFDVVAGLVKRAPEVWQKLGLEWLYRTLQEPRRLWKRYLVTNTIFVGMIMRDAMRALFTGRKTD